MFSQPTSPSLIHDLGNRATHNAAIARFALVYTPSICSYAKQRCHVQDADLEEIAQAVLIRVHNSFMRQIDAQEADMNGVPQGNPTRDHIGEYRPLPGRKFRVWLRKVVLNECRDYFRRERRHQAVGGTIPEMPMLPETPEDEAMNEAEYLAGVLASLGQEGVKSGAFIEPTWRAFWEWAVKGRPTAEVAAELDIKPGSVHVAVCRVRAWIEPRLRELLD